MDLLKDAKVELCDLQKCCSAEKINDSREQHNVLPDESMNNQQDQQIDDGPVKFSKEKQKNEKRKIESFITQKKLVVQLCDFSLCSKEESHIHDDKKVTHDDEKSFQISNKHEILINEPVTLVDVPKRPQSAYFFFSEDFRKKIANTVSKNKFCGKRTCSATEMRKLVGRKWKAMSDADKMPFVELEIKSKSRYALEMEKYLESISDKNSDEGDRVEICEGHSRKRRKKYQQNDQAPFLRKKGRDKAINYKEDSSEDSDIEELKEEEKSDSDWEPRETENQSLEKLEDSDSDSETTKVKKQTLKEDEESDSDCKPRKTKNQSLEKLEDSDSDWETTKIETHTKKEEEKCLTPLNEFQKARQKNIADKMEFLKSLQTKEIADEIRDIVKSKKQTRYPRKQYFIEKRSKRLENVKINLSEKALEAKCYVEEKKDIKSIALLPKQYPFENALGGESQELLKTYKKYFNNLKVETKYSPSFKHNIDCLVPSPIAVKDLPVLSCLDFHPAVNNTLLFGGDVSGQVIIWNIDSDPLTFAPHIDFVTHMKVNPETPYSIISSSRDGTLRQADLQSNQFVNIFKDKDSLNYFDFVTPSVILVAQANGFVSSVDIRIKRTSSSVRWKCHELPIRTVNVHPTNEYVYLTLDYRGSMKVWDRRSSTQPFKEICSFSSTDKIFSAFYSPITGKKILCSSRKAISIYDNFGSYFILSKRFDVQHTSTDSLEIQRQKRKVFLRHLGKVKRDTWDLSTNYFDSKSYTKASWLSNSDDLFSVGNNFLKKISVLDILGKEVCHFNYEKNIVFIPFHPVKNMFALVNKRVDHKYRVNIYSKPV